MSLEQFIQKNRAEFDSEQPRAAVWDSIQAALSEPQIAPPGKVWSIWRNVSLVRVAAAVALLLIGTVIGMRISRSDETKILAELGPEYQEAVSYYQRDINAKREKLAQFATLKNSVEADLMQLEQVMEELKSELKDVPPARRQEVISAMIDNYKMRARILEKVLQKIEQKNTRQNEPTHL